MAKRADVVDGMVVVTRNPGPDPGELRPMSASVPAELTIHTGSFDAFFRQELRGLVALLTAVTGSTALAEELAQEAMVRAHQRWSRISAYEDPGAWVRRVGLNLAFNARARRRTERHALERLAVDRSLTVTTLHRDDGPDEFWAIVRRLPRRQAAAVVLHYLEDRPVTEVATILGCAEGTAKAHLHKGRARLAQLIETPGTETHHGPRPTS